MFSLLSTMTRENLIDIAPTNAMLCINIYERRIRRVNGRFLFYFVSISRLDNWANCFRNTIAVSNFSEASNGHANKKKCSDASMVINGDRLEKVSLGEGRGSYPKKYDASKRKIGNVR